MTDPNGTRERLIRAAVAAFDLGGESAIRIRDIATECGVTAPSIYHFFGSREGLIEAALAYRYFTGQFAIGSEFAQRVFACKNKAEFVSLVHTTLAEVFSADRASFRATRVSVLGNTHTRPRLADNILDVQRTFDQRLAEPVRFAQAKGWIRDDFNPDTFGSWLVGLVNGRMLVELNPEHSGARDWDTMSMRAVCAVFGIPEPQPRGNRRK